MNRRGFLGGLLSAFAAPAIVRIDSIMPVRVMPPELAEGIVPIDIADELLAITRKAFVPKLVVQIYKATPMLSLLMKNRDSGRALVPFDDAGNKIAFSWGDFDARILN